MRSVNPTYEPSGQLVSTSVTFDPVPVAVPVRFTCIAVARSRLESASYSASDRLIILFGDVPPLLGSLFEKPVSSVPTHVLTARPRKSKTVQLIVPVGSLTRLRRPRAS